MNYVQLGHSGLKVSPVCLGTMMFGSGADEAESRRIIDKVRDFGVNFIDTADVYNAGTSEEIIGRAIAADRDRWIVATKVGAGGAGESGLLAGPRVISSAKASARRLQTDRIDIYYLHREEHSTPLEETIRRHRRTDPRWRHPLFRRVELPGMARRRNLQAVRRSRYRPSRHQPALLQCAQPHAGSRASAGLRPLRPQRISL
jgi:hypothetical protein